jgi:uncharacterized protein (TIGR02271 family)
MTQTTLIALYDARDEAAQAAERLVAEVGIARSDITVMAQDRGTSAAGDTADTNVFESLQGLRIADADRHAYAEAIRRGGSLLTVQVEDVSAERAMDVVEEQGAVDIDDRQQTWRAEGWSGHQAPDTRSQPAPARHGKAAEDDTITLAEEQLGVGKRSVGGGRVRVRKYVVETPVEEQITLRDEHVSVEHHKMDRPATAADEGLFEERMVEMTETGEKVVVSKTAHVTGEVTVSKGAEERVETVRDTVRRTEVEVDDDRATDGRVARQTPTKTSDGGRPTAQPDPANQGTRR